MEIPLTPMTTSSLRCGSAAVCLAFVASTAAAQPASRPAASAPAATAAVATVPGMPPVPDRSNLYSETTQGKMSDATRGALARVYVPHLQSNDVWVIDPATLKVVDKFRVGLNPQHVVPSWDLKTLWVANNAENTTKGSLTPIDPTTGKPGKPIAVDAQLVRSARLNDAAAASAAEGVRGDPRRASAALGNAGVDLIVARTRDSIAREVARR